MTRSSNEAASQAVIQQQMWWNLMAGAMVMGSICMLEFWKEGLINDSDRGLVFFCGMYITILPVSFAKIYGSLLPAFNSRKSIESVNKIRLIMIFFVISSVFLLAFPFLALDPAFESAGRAGLFQRVININAFSLILLGSLLTFSAALMLAISVGVVKILMGKY